MAMDNPIELFDISGKVVAITGAGGVLCGTMAKACGAIGAKVAVLDILEKAAQKVADQINDAGGEAIAIKCDVLDRAGVEHACETVIKKFGTVDILINGAGGNKKEASTDDTHKFFDMPVDAIKWVFDLNFIGTLLPSQVFGKIFVEKKEGVILNISSMNALKPLTKIAAYSAAKAAVSNFTQWLAVHMAQNYSPKIRVNALAPGFFLTEQNRFLLIDEKTGKLTERGQLIIDNTPQGRFGGPEQLIGAVMWLLSPASQFVTGITLPVDGGFDAFSGV